MVHRRLCLEIEIPSGVKLFISNVALSREKRDRHIIEEFKHYAHEIQMIVNELSSRHQEMIGHFRISPRGHNENRVAWHMDEAGDYTEVFIDDLLKHKNMHYTCHWDEKVRDGRVSREKYLESGYLEVK